jgi:Asp-tRNA(Asn)/Glu-tRNA(Gln) amidotransferase A subunit family amidase
LSAAEALRLFRALELSPVELAEAVISRAETVEPTLNAIVISRTGRRVAVSAATTA